MTELSRADMTAAQRKAVAIILVAMLSGISLAGVLNLWLVKDAARAAVPDRWTATDMRHWVEQAEALTGLNLPTPEHKPENKP